MSVIPMKAPASAPTLHDLAKSWLQAKADEKAANELRLEVERQILLHSKAVDEGTVTLAAGDLVVKIGYSLDRKIDQDVLESTVAKSLPEDNLKRLFPYVPKLELKELRYLQDTDAEKCGLAAVCLTTKPAKPSIAVASAKKAS